MLPPVAGRASGLVCSRFVVLLLIFAIIFAALPKQFAPIIPSVLAASNTIVISEVDADPPLAGTDTANEWFELQNVSAGTITLTNWTITDNTSSDTIPTVTLGAGGRVIIAGTAAGFASEHSGFIGTVLAIADNAIGNGLANGGDRLILKDGNGVEVDAVSWGTNITVLNPAPGVDGSGNTNQRNAAGTDTDTAADWSRAAETPNGNTNAPTGTPTPTPTPIPTATPTPTPTPASTSPSGTGSANPISVQAGNSSLLTVNVTPGTNPASSGLAVTADLSSIGGAFAQAFSGSGNTFTFQATVAAGTTPGVKTLPVTISDSQGRSGSASISLTVEQPPPPVNHVVISQVYSGGGNSGAAYQNDYIELYNPGTTSFDLTGWSLQYASSTGSGWDTNKQPLGGSIQPGEYYLVSLASGGTVGSPLPAANISGEINMSGTAGKIALVSNSEGLSGNCPLSDSDLIDLIGYGSAADCREGSTNAPGPGSSAKAVFRKNGGVTDTNQNGNDFVSADALPRRTAPIVELGPWVASTDPRSNGANVPADASLTVNFSEPVNVTGAWFSLNCATTGQHNEATVTGSSRSYVITPNVSFASGEQCTITVNQESIHDQDLDDSGPNTDTLSANYSWTFTTSSGEPAPYPQEVHLTMGNPSQATADINEPNNYLMEKPAFTLSYNRDKGTPNWVSWHLDESWTGNLTRVDTFRPDPAVPSDWYRVQATDYFGSGFDRGHMTPNADRDNPNSIPLNQATFLMTNMVPQAPDNNQGPWASMENDLRALFTDGSGNKYELYVVSGGAGIGGTSSNGTMTTIANGRVTVPASTWKVALVLPKDAGDDLLRVNAATRTIAVIMPNTQGIRANDWRNYLVSVDQVEALTGYNFFSNVPDSIENSIEAGINGANPPGTEDQAATTGEDTPANITLTAVNPNNTALTYTTVSGPAHGSLTGSGAHRIYTPAPDFIGTDSFTFRASDGVRNSNVSTVTITITEVNEAPVANADARSTQEDTMLTFPANDLSANDLAGDANESGQTLTVKSVRAGADTHGTVALADGQVIYTPDPNYHGPASFEYGVCDDGTTAGAPDSKCSAGTVGITVGSVNDSPTASHDSAATDEDTPVTIDVRANDGDIDGDPLTISAVTQGAHGAVVITGDGAISYSPAPDYIGTDSFSYTVSDGHGGTSTATVSITVRDTTAPALTVPGIINTEATSADGTLVTYFISAADNSGIAPFVQCTAVSGSVFPIGSTPVMCQATDGSGNQSPVLSFQVNVVDLPPVLTLPATIITNSTATGGGAAVSFSATANDTVSGVRAVSCDHPSGSFFNVGQTNVTCSATDSAGQTSRGNFLVYVLSGGQQGDEVPTGTNVPVQTEGGPALTFAEVTSPGVTTVAPISDPAEIGQIPSGFAISDAVAFKIETTATFDSIKGVTLAFVVPSDNLTLADFTAMTVLHNHNGVLEELTVTSRDFSTRTIYAVTHSFSSFYLARKVDKKVVPLFNPAEIYQSGSTIPVKVKLTDLAGRNISAPGVVLNARAIRLLATAVAASQVANDSGHANVDNNFRFIGTDGGSYLYNLSTKGFAPGHYVLSLYVGKDRFFHTVTFNVK